jgi:hypothetical protein
MKTTARGNIYWTRNFTHIKRVLSNRPNKEVYSSITDITELQDDLDKFIYDYNLKRTTQGYRLKGKIPDQKFYR